jgi:hypothetical protein
MKVNFKPVIDNSEQLNLHISPTLKQRIEKLRTRGKALGLDYNATMVAYFEEFVTESESQMDALEQSATKSVAEQPSPNARRATKSVATPLTDSSVTAQNNGTDQKLA